jgi:hypothetical protein
MALPTLEHKAHHQVEDEEVGRDNSELPSSFIGLWPPQPKRTKPNEAVRQEDQNLQPFWPIRALCHTQPMIAGASS